MRNCSSLSFFHPPSVLVVSSTKMIVESKDNRPSLHLSCLPSCLMRMILLSNATNKTLRFPSFTTTAIYLLPLFSSMYAGLCGGGSSSQSPNLLFAEVYLYLESKKFMSVILWCYDCCCISSNRANNALDSSNFSFNLCSSEGNPS